jgi:hypothetical protein
LTIPRPAQALIRGTVLVFALGTAANANEMLLQERATALRAELQGEAKVEELNRVRGAVPGRETEKVGDMGGGAGKRTFHVVVEAPFVVIGDEGTEQVEQRAAGTVRWAVAQLRKTYFADLPTQPLEIWLLADEAAYQSVSQNRFDITPPSPFGFYASQHRALVINIARGSGTLVHEIVHPLMAHNFPNCPVWFDEGLASLYEECTEQDGQIWGLPNWRLRRLRHWLDSDALPSFESLCSLSRNDFYGEHAARNYAQARYLCLYLQHHDKLPSLYRTMHANRATDPSGWQSLCNVLYEIDALRTESSVDHPRMSGNPPPAFLAHWHQFIRGLPWPAEN